MIDAILGGLFWRFRGMNQGWFWSGLFAILCAYILVQHGVSQLAAGFYALWVWLGERPGWGAPLGQAMGYPDSDREPEWYQRLWGGYLWRHPWQALMFRGAMIGGIGAIALPLGAWLANRLESYLPDLPLLRGKWEWQEAFFGALFILILEVIILAAT